MTNIRIHPRSDRPDPKLQRLIERLALFSLFANKPYASHQGEPLSRLDKEPSLKRYQNPDDYIAIRDPATSTLSRGGLVLAGYMANEVVIEVPVNDFPIRAIRSFCRSSPLTLPNMPLYAEDLQNMLKSTFSGLSSGFNVCLVKKAPSFAVKEDDAHFIFSMSKQDYQLLAAHMLELVANTDTAMKLSQAPNRREHFQLLKRPNHHVLRGVENILQYAFPDQNTCRKIINIASKPEHENYWLAHLLTKKPTSTSAPDPELQPNWTARVAPTENASSIAP